MTATSKTAKTPRKAAAGKQATDARASTQRPRKAAVAETVPETKKASKLDLILGYLFRPEGASLAELVAATGWQPHSLRGALAGSLKKKGHTIISEKVEGERRYRVGAGE